MICEECEALKPSLCICIEERVVVEESKKDEFYEARKQQAKDFADWSYKGNHL